MSPAVPAASVRCDSFPTLKTPGTGEGRSEPLLIEDVGFKRDQLLVPNHYRNDIDRVLLPHGLILDRIEKIAYDIVRFYNDEEFNLICILKGSRGFFNHLIHFINKMSNYDNSPRKGPPYLEHYVRVKSYENANSSGQIQVIAEDLSGLKGKHVLIVEDIIDTGVTLTKFCDWLETEVKPKDIAVTSLLEKRTNRSCGFKGDFVGFSVPDEFVVGFSLDYNELYRDLEHICVLSRDAIQRHARPVKP